VTQTWKSAEIIQRPENLSGRATVAEQKGLLIGQKLLSGHVKCGVKSLFLRF